MTRAALLDYCGARGRVAITEVLRLDPRRWAVQEKHDGSLAHVYLDSRGRIERLLSRSGRAFGPELVGDLVGAFVGAPDSVLVGELEAWSEAAGRAVEERGYRVCHLFDAIRVGGRYLAREPYRVRRDWLYRGQSWAVQERGRAAFEVDGEGHAHDRQGRFCRPVPRDWQLTPIVDQAAPAHAAELWERASVGGAEGLVAVALDAPIGRRGAKRKCKPTRSIDAVVETADRKAAIVRWGGGSFVVSARARGLELVPGAVVEVLCDGFTERGSLPKHPRITRRRPDLEGVGA
jgi:ATP-dependent DNA ligase